VPPRLDSFLDPFIARLQRSEQVQHAIAYIAGLVAGLQSKNVESIAYLHGQAREPLQQFIGQSPWDHQLWLTELAGQVGRKLGSLDGVLVFGPSAFLKKGSASVGVQRQRCGRLGKIENCQVGIYLAYVGRDENALVDVHLYLPREWAQDGPRRAQAGVPKAVPFRTWHELALWMLDERGPLLPHAWVSGDDELGRCTEFRQELTSRGEHYLLAGPSDTAVQCLTEADPAHVGDGCRPRAPCLDVQRWCAAVPEAAWQTVEICAGDQGPAAVQAVCTPVEARTEDRGSGVAETLVVFREQQADGRWRHDYLLSNAPLTTSVSEFARVFKAGHRIEECLQRAEGEAGLADYEVRTWRGWHHHQALALTATWFLASEARDGEKVDAVVDGGEVAGTSTPLPLESPQPLPSTLGRSAGMAATVGIRWKPLRRLAPLSASQREYRRPWNSARSSPGMEGS
jgi:SRSO17 transposase